MMSIYADDVVLTDTAHDNSGKAEAGRYWGPSAPSITGSATHPRCACMREVESDKATFYFECWWMDVDNNGVGTDSFSDMKLMRVHGHWLVKDDRVGKIEKL